MYNTAVHDSILYAILLSRARPASTKRGGIRNKADHYRQPFMRRETRQGLLTRAITVRLTLRTASQKSDI
jgi:hypothetical protein